MTTSTTGSDGASPRKRYHLLETEDFWRAASSRFEWNSGWIFFDKKSGNYSAGYRDSKILLPKLRSGNYSNSDDCPLDELGRPKADFLMLLALREQVQFESPGRQFDPVGWRKRAIDASVAEQERETRRALPEKNLKNANEIANSLAKFEKHVGVWLARVVVEPNSGKVFRRLANWLDAIDRLEEIGIPEDYQRFFAAVEEAARQAGSVPTQKAVREVFNDNLSENQKGQGHTFRSLMTKLKFSWLPVGGRGTAAIQKKSGI